MLRPDFGRLWSWFVVICLQCPVFFHRRLLLCHPAYAAPGQGVRPCPPRERSASTGADHPSLPLFSRLWTLFSLLAQRKEYLRKFLQKPLELSPSLPLFFLDFWSSLTTWRGRKGKAPSHSWFGWNLIWRAALGSSHSCHQSKNNRKQLCIWAALILRNLRLWRVTPCVLWQLCDWNRFEMRFEGVKRGERSAFVSHRSAGKTDTQRETPPTNTDTYRAPRPPTLKQTDRVPPSRCRLGENVFLVPPCFFYDTSIIFPREVGRRNKL